MHDTKLQDLEDAMVRRFQARFECDLTADELADFAELDADYEAEVERLFAEQLAERGIEIEAMLADMHAPYVGGDGAPLH